MSQHPTPLIGPIGELAQAEPASGYDRVVAYLTAQLMSNALKVGDRLLPERELAARLNVSRPVLREALRSLAMIGVLEIKQGYGTFVRSPDLSNLGHLFTFMMSKQENLIGAIMEVRIALERQAVRLACERARRQDDEAIGKAFDLIVATIEDVVVGGKADFEFHTALVRSSHSSALVEIYDVVSIMLQGSHIARRNRIALTSRYREFLIDHHEQLWKALQRRDPEESERLLMQHFEIGDELSSTGHGPRRA